MTTYKIPAQPDDVDVIWLVAAVTTRWERDRHTGTWRSDDVQRAWHELLQLGVIHDVHPTLSAAQPTPWRIAFEGSDEVELRDAKDNYVDMLREGNVQLIASSVNEYAELLNR